MLFESKSTGKPINHRQRITITKSGNHCGSAVSCVIRHTSILLQAEPERIKKVGITYTLRDFAKLRAPERNRARPLRRLGSAIRLKEARPSSPNGHVLEDLVSEVHLRAGRIPPESRRSTRRQRLRGRRGPRFPPRRAGTG